MLQIYHSEQHTVVLSCIASYLVLLVLLPFVCLSLMGHYVRLIVVLVIMVDLQRHITGCNLASEILRWHCASKF